MADLNTIITDIAPLNVQRPNGMVVIHAKQSDGCSRFYRAEMYDGTEPWTPGTGVSAMLRYKKPDGHFGAYDEMENGEQAITVSNNVVTFGMTEQALNVPGRVLVDLTFYQSASAEHLKRLSTFNILLDVEPAPVSDDVIIDSKDYVSVLGKGLAAAAALIGMTVSASDAGPIDEGGTADVHVTGGPDEGTVYNFDFELPSGKRGLRGYRVSQVLPDNVSLTPGGVDTYKFKTEDGSDVAGTFQVYNGMNGIGVVNSVDGVQPNGTNVQLNALRVPQGSDQVQALTTEQIAKIRKALGIGSMASYDYILPDGSGVTDNGIIFGDITESQYNALVSDVQNTKNRVANVETGKMDVRTVVTEPIENSPALITSGGVYDALSEYIPGGSIDTEVTEDSTNLVTSGAVYDAVDSVTKVVGDLGDLKTEEKATLVDAVNELAEKSSVDVASSAEQLLSSTGVEDKVPYVFRQTGGGAEGVGTRLDEEIVGGTIAWNQLNNDSLIDGSQNGITWSKNNHAWSISGTASAETAMNIGSAIALGANHVYFLKGCPTGGGADTYYFGFGGIKTDYGQGGLWKNVNSYATTVPQLRIKSGVTINVTNQFFIVCDLTQMFGAAIADQIFTLENATAGAGVALFRSLFPNDFYAYNSGELLSVNAASHDTVGFNLWDTSKDNINKGIGASGELLTNNTLCTSDYILISPNAACYLLNVAPSMNAISYAFYDQAKNYISKGSISGSTSVSGEVVPPHNAYYIRVSRYKTQEQAGFNLSDPSRNGTYEPYQKHTYPLDNTLTLRGVPKLDANNRLYYDGDIYSPDGSVKRRYGVVDLGTLTWTYYTGGTNPVFYASVTGAKTYASGTQIKTVAGKYTVANMANSRSNLSTNMPDGNLSWISGSTNVIIRDTAYTDAATFQAALSGVMLVYELATPTTETAEPYQQIQVVDPLGTEEFVDAGVLAGTRDVAVPVGHNSFYMTDLRKKIEGIPGDFSKLLAPIESGFTASKAYAVNDFLIVNSQLYKVTAPIANAATITPGTNVTATTVGEVLSALLNS